MMKDASNRFQGITERALAACNPGRKLWDVSAVR